MESDQRLKHNFTYKTLRVFVNSKRHHTSSNVLVFLGRKMKGLTADGASRPRRAPPGDVPPALTRRHRRGEGVYMSFPSGKAHVMGLSEARSVHI